MYQRRTPSEESLRKAYLKVEEALDKIIALKDRPHRLPIEKKSIVKFWD